MYRLIGAQAGHYLLHVDSGEVHRVASMHDFQLPTDWSGDGRRLLGECPPLRYGVCELDLASGKVNKLLVHPTDQILYPTWSWDARAITFMRRQPGGPAAIWIAPVDSNGAVEPETR